MLILEDNADRCEAMIAALREIDSRIEFAVADSAADFTRGLAERLRNCNLICLDHDLGPSRLFGDVRQDPGDGRDVAMELAKHAPCCPVLIHSTNRAGAQSMSLMLRDAGWKVIQIAPYGDLEWIREAWLPQMKTCLLIDDNSQ